MVATLDQLKDGSPEHSSHSRTQPLLWCLGGVLVTMASLACESLSAQSLESFLPAASEVSPDAVVVDERLRDDVAVRVFALEEGSLNFAVRRFADPASAKSFVDDFTDAEVVADGFAQGIASASGLDPDSVTFATSDPQLGDKSGTVLVRIFIDSAGVAIAALTFSTGVYAVHMQLAGPVGADPTGRAEALGRTVLEKIHRGMPNRVFNLTG